MPFRAMRNGFFICCMGGLARSRAGFTETDFHCVAQTLLLGI